MALYLTQHFSHFVETNHSWSEDILRILAHVPKHLRKSIIVNKVREFASMSDEQKSETVNSVLEGYRYLDKANLVPLLTTCFQVISALDTQLIVNTFRIYLDIYLLNPQLILSLDLQPVLEALESLNSIQKQVLLDCYFEAVLLHHDRDRLKSVIPEFAIELLKTKG